MRVPIIGNQPTEPELVPALTRALAANPAATAALVRHHGLCVRLSQPAIARLRD